MIAPSNLPSFVIASIVESISLGFLSGEVGSNKTIMSYSSPSFSNLFIKSITTSVVLPYLLLIHQV